MKLNRLPDHVRPGLEVLLVGINPGLRSAEVGHHFAGVNNRFWDLLWDAGITPRRLSYEDDGRLVDFGIGLTNIAARPTRSISELGRKDYARGRLGLVEKIARLKPALVAFVGVTAYREFRRGSTVPPARIRCGLQKDRIERAPVFVLPNPSGRNAHYTYAQMRRYWKRLALLMKSARRISGPVRRGFSEGGSLGEG